MSQTSQTSNKPFAEVIESSLDGWLAQTWQWDHFPSFGSLVTVASGKRTLFGIVHQVKTGSMDPVRFPMAYQKTEDELLLEQPQIFEFLKTTFSCLTLGYLEKGRIFYQLAPEPPKIHTFVSPVTPELGKRFFYSERYLHVLFGQASQLSNLDELLLAILKQLASLKALSPETIGDFAQSFSLLTGNDYRRLKLFLLRAQQFVESIP